MNFLIVEDSLIDFKILNRVLKSIDINYVTSHAVNLVDAREKLSQNSYDFIFMDFSLPDTVKWEGIEEVRKTAPGTPFVIITGMSSEDNGVEAVKKGVEDFIEKNLISKKLISYIIRSSVERANLKKETALALAKAEEAEKSKSNFLANMSHEIRTPLNLILGNTELLEETKLTDYQKTLASSFSAAGKHLLSIINDLLDLSSIETNHFKYIDTFIDLNEEFEEIAAIAEPTCNLRNLNFSTYLDPEIPETVLCDPTRLKQVILNLLNNSIKFTEKGFVSLSARLIEKKTLHSIIEFAVKDSGVGIEKGHINKIFNHFYQTDQGMKRQYGGSGIGLSIAQTIVSHYKGSFDVESSLGKGCLVKFQLSLPHGKSKFFMPQEIIETKNLTTQKILVVDDDVDNRGLVSAFLKNTPYDLTFAESGEQALSFVKQDYFDLVLMDVQMPGKDGFEVTKIIRDNKDLIQPRILGFSANAMQSSILKAKEIGMSGYITKPIRKKKLIAAIETKFDASKAFYLEETK